MAKQRFRILSIFFMLIAVSQSSLIVPRSAPEEDTSGDEEIGKDGRYPGISDPGDPNFGDYNFIINPRRQDSYPTDDDGSEDEIDAGKLGAEPENNLSDSDRDENLELDDGEDENDIQGSVDKVNGNDDTDDYGSLQLLDAEGLDESGGNKYPDELGDDEIGKVPANWADKILGDKGIGPFKFKDFFSGESSIFDIFNIPKDFMEKVRKYYRRLEKALGYVFRETLNEARLLNGTYANTTEEEVEIGGKKFVVQKSIIKGKDNNSTIYVETLSSKQKEEGGQETNGTETKA